MKRLPQIMAEASQAETKLRNLELQTGINSKPTLIVITQADWSEEAVKRAQSVVQKIESIDKDIVIIMANLAAQAGVRRMILSYVNEIKSHLTEEIIPFQFSKTMVINEEPKVPERKLLFVRGKKTQNVSDIFKKYIGKKSTQDKLLELRLQGVQLEAKAGFYGDLVNKKEGAIYQIAYGNYNLPGSRFAQDSIAIPVYSKEERLKYAELYKEIQELKEANQIEIHKVKAKMYTLIEADQKASDEEYKKEFAKFQLMKKSWSEKLVKYTDMYNVETQAKKKEYLEKINFLNNYEIELPDLIL